MDLSLRMLLFPIYFFDSFGFGLIFHGNDQINMGLLKFHFPFATLPVIIIIIDVAFIFQDIGQL